MSKGNKEEQKWLLGESLNQYDRSLKEELNKVEKRNREQNHKISALINAFDDDYIKKEEENTNISLDYSKEGIVIVDDIKGNTLVNNIKDSNKELVLNGDIDTSGYNNITLTEGTDGGKVDIALEGNTMVNVCDQEEPIAITKNYEVTTVNHIALQGEYDGKCRPNIYGNTLVSCIKDVSIKDVELVAKKGGGFIQSPFYDLDKFLFKTNTTYTFIAFIKENTVDGDVQLCCNHSRTAIQSTTILSQPLPTDIIKFTFKTKESFENIDLGLYHQLVNCTTGKLAFTQMIIEGDYTNKPIPDYFTGMKSSFEDKLITDEKDAHNGKYKVDYKVTGKNKCPRCVNTSVSNNGITLTYDATTQTFSYSGTATKTSVFISVGCPDLKLLKNKSYIFSVDNPLTDFDLQATELGVGYNCNLPTGQSATPIVNLDKFTSNSIMLYSQKLTIGQSYSGTFKVQIEEGDTATTYEPYKEYIKTLYLNSPLLEGDTIEQSGNDIVHMHNYNKVVFDGSDDEDWGDYYKELEGSTCIWTKMPKEMKITERNYSTLICDKLCYIAGGFINNSTNISTYVTNDHNNNAIYVRIMNTQLNSSNKQGVIQWLQQNPITVVYELQTPTKEVISTNDNLLLDSYINGHLDVDTVIPIDKVAFQSYGTSLKYLSPNTEYTIQFESDSNGKLDALALNSSDVIGNLNIVKGINKFTITTSDKITINYLWTTGIGFNMSKVVVTPKVDGDFGYFKGMKSVGQNDVDGHKIEILSHNKFLGMNDDNITLRSSSSRQGFNKFTIIGSESWNSEVHFDVNSSDVPIGTNIKIRIKVLENTNPSMNNSNLKSWQLTDFNVDNFDYSLLNKWQEIEYNVNKEYTGSANSKLNLMIFGLKNTALPTDRMVAEIEVEINNSKKSNKKEILMNEPLRGLPNGVRDKYVMIDGKWYIERNINKLKVNNEKINQVGFGTDIEGYSKWKSAELECLLNNPTTGDYNNENNFICDTYITKANWNIKNIVFIEKNTLCLVIPNKYNAENIHEHINSLNIIYQLKTPTYEPIDYNPFEVYSDITHISNNSIIPCNMVIKNSGYNCILKPNTKYTVVTNTQNSISAKIGSTKVDSTNNVFTIITPSTLTDSVLRFSGKGLTTKNIMLLEGDKTNYIPGYFTGMESAFEQELVTDEKDKNYGKYKVNVKVTDGNKENNITFYINEPLRGTEDIKDKVYVKEDKVVVERNFAEKILNGTEDWKHDIKSSSQNIGRFSFNNIGMKGNRGLVICDKCSFKTNYTLTSYNYEGAFTSIGGSVLFLDISLNKLETKDLNGFKKWLSENPTTVVYQLATSVYEEVECDLSKLMLENYENSSLILNSNIPPTVDVRYKGELPIVSATKELSSNVESTTTDINQNIIPYMCDMDYRIVELQLKNASTQGLEVNVLGLDSEDVLFNNRKANKIFNPSYEMLKRDILSERYSSDEYKYRLERYLLADKISNEEYNELEELINGR